MHTAKIADGIFSVGVLNPNMRVFDIVMKTDYGTSYNAYLVKGSEKTALIETSHLRFFDYFLDNIKMAADVESIDYLILNHCEPDHSGAVAKLVQLMPHVKIITSQAGSIYIKNITNRTDLNLQVVKDGDSIDLGGKTLRFINAPFLHWPDTMFTWCQEEGVLFPCDFLGAHYCEPEVFDARIAYPSAYKTALRGYYDAIFGPFKPYVLKGLEKIKDLPIQYACPSHGPILSNGKDGLLCEVLQNYRAWSTPLVKEHKSIPVFYCTAYGNTRLLANQIAAGMQEVFPDAQIPVYDVIEHDMGMLAELLNGSDAFVIGSPTLNADALPPIWNLLAGIDAVNIKKRPAALFGSYGWSGEAVGNLRGRLTSLKVKVFEKDCRVIFVPSESDLLAAKEFGKEFAQTL